MRLTLLLGIVLAASCLAGCFGGDDAVCADPTLYASSGSAPPVRVPQGLSVPDESQALQIPSGEPIVPPAEGEPLPCLEAPPDFFDEEDDD